MRDRRYSLAAVAVVIGMPAVYAVFQYGEPFVTPRLFAETLTMVALGLLVRHRTGWSFAVLALSLPIHPIMTLPGLGIAVLYLALERPLWWLAVPAGMIAVMGLSFANVPPFADLRISLDPL